MHGLLGVAAGLAKIALLVLLCFAGFAVGGGGLDNHDGFAASLAKHDAVAQLAAESFGDDVVFDVCYDLCKIYGDKKV